MRPRIFWDVFAAVCKGRGRGIGAMEEKGCVVWRKSEEEEERDGGGL